MALETPSQAWRLQIRANTCWDPFPLVNSVRKRTIRLDSTLGKNDIVSVVLVIGSTAPAEIG